ncbi:MAG: calcium/sodium antiporter [Opitutaceae bacterium]|jgi:cation:H+ antiporter
MNPWLALALGLVVLYFGAQALVKGGASLALRLGLTPLVIGLTVMAFGTSSPEMVVSVQAGLTGNGAISIGNVVGSNICNIALILGLCALVTPLTASVQVIRREVPIMIGASVVALLMLMDGHLARWEGAVLLTGLIVYTVVTVRQARAETAATEAAKEYTTEIGPKPEGLGKSVALVVGGLAGLILGSHFFVQGAVTLAESWGMSQVAIGLTIVAVGTSLPELATSLVAALKKESDVAIGNVVGSNTFNVLGILGVAALIRPIDAPGLEWGDLLVMLVVAIALLPLAKSGGRVSRWEGAALFSTYVGYTAWLLLRSSA